MKDIIVYYFFELLLYESTVFVDKSDLEYKIIRLIRI